MLSKDDIIKRYGEPDLNKKNNFINYDAIDSLPDELEMVISELKFDPKKLYEYFTNVGTEKKPSWYPQTDVMYKIAEMCGIQGTTYKSVEWITNEVDINPLLMKSIMDEPTMRKIITSARVTKQSKILCEDGRFRLGTPETNEFDFFTRACLDFIKDEEYNNGKPNKYKTSISRQRRLLESKKFAIQQAETKAFCKTIRVLAGLPTGFLTKDLEEGKLIFHKFIKSKRIQKMETAARIEALRKGHTGEIQQTSNNIFGQQQIDAPVNGGNFDTENNQKKTKNPFEDIPTTPPITPPVDEKTELKNLIEQYYNDNFEIIDKVKNAKDFILNIVSNYKTEKTEMLKDTIKRIEAIKDIKIIDHKFNLGKDVF